MISTFKGVQRIPTISTSPFIRLRTVKSYTKIAFGHKFVPLSFQIAYQIRVVSRARRYKPGSDQSLRTILARIRP